jgi:hypothetical protein
MATIRLGRYEARQGNLPAVCMRCGTATRLYRKRIFNDSPWWIYVGILLGLFPVFVLVWYRVSRGPVLGPIIWSLSVGIPLFIVAWYRSRSASVRVPLCLLHRNLWRLRQPVLILACAMVSVGFGVIPLDMVSQGRFSASEEEKIVPFASLAIFAGPYLYLGAVITLKYLGIHATKVDANSITLTGVAVEFAEAVRVEHESASTDKQSMNAEAPQLLRNQP